MGGEHFFQSVLIILDRGSSPRGRGTLAFTDETDGNRDFIPAWAGNTTNRPRRGRLPTVHPRVGGEHGSTARANARYCGSSPRGRGTRKAFHEDSQGRRFIPAWAGNTATGPSCNSLRTVHPRVGGEHSATAFATDETDGSSPRGRGTPNPALRSGFRTAVHPRVGGEHRVPRSCRWATVGSSPRGRGTQLSVASRSHRFRFIPAWAGNTWPISCCWRGGPVHPRVGGEHIRSFFRISSCSGSSPRGRGTPAGAP